MKLKSISTAITFFLLLFSFSPFCSADGCIFSEARRKLPNMPVQRALIKYYGGTETLIIEPTLDGEGLLFGWIIPVPNIPNKFEKISPGLLKTLSFQLQPEIKHKTRTDTLILFLWTVLVVVACVYGMFRGVIQGVFLFLLLSVLLIFIAPNFIAYQSGPVSSPMVKSPVSVESRQIVGSYEIFVLKAKESADLNLWLKDNDFGLIPEKDLPIIDYYIRQKWCFVAAAISIDYEEIFTPHPILIEFNTDMPVYPMRLTSLQGSNLYLELFVVASKEAAPIGYTFKKDYCDLFYYSTISDSYFYYGHNSGTRKAFIGINHLGGRQQIGHPDVRKIMWHGCVVTKLLANISSTEMKKDVFFNFVNATPYRSMVYSRAGALELAAVFTTWPFMIGFLILTVIYGSSKEHNALYFIKLFLILLFVCINVFTWTYVGVGEKVEAILLSRSGKYEWKNFIGDALAVIGDTVNFEEQITDTELSDLLEQTPNSDLKNPFTKGPVVIEDSPGNITVERKYGLIAGIKLYQWDGSPYFLPSFDYLRQLDIEYLKRELKDDNPEVRMRAALELGVRNDPGAIDPLETALKDENQSVRNNALIALAKIKKDSNMVEPLIGILKRAVLKNNYYEQKIVERALRKLTGEDFGKDHVKWQNWWEKNMQTTSQYRRHLPKILEIKPVPRWIIPQSEGQN